jgi:hypothetical protein
MIKYSLNKIEKDSVNSVITPIDYSKLLETSNIDFSNIKVSFIGTGYPDSNLSGEISSFENFTNIDKTDKDIHGLSTMISGVLNSKNDFITGACNKINTFTSKVFYSKNKSLETDDNCIICSILWSLIKKVDIIVIPFEIKNPSSDLINCFKKVYDNNICLLINTNKRNFNDNTIFETNEILGVSSNFKEEVVLKVDIKEDYYTTFIKDNFIKCNSLLSSTFGSIQAAKIINQKKNKKEKYTPTTIYNELLKNKD